MAKKGKKYVEAAKLVDRAKAYDVAEAVSEYKHALSFTSSVRKYNCTADLLIVFTRVNP
jgi:large subunit ribosomal protein L1